MIAYKLGEDNIEFEVHLTVKVQKIIENRGQRLRGSFELETRLQIICL